MKKFLSIPMLVLFASTSCEKEQNLPALPISAPPTRVSTYSPQAFAGPDFYIVLPADSAMLQGRAEDHPSDTLRYNWKKISGPASCVIEGPELLQAKARNLVKGTYRFVLTVTDQGGLSGRDTVSVDVDEPHPVPVSNELIVGDLQWIFPWYASIEVKNIIRYPAPRKVFIQRNFNGIWVEVSPISSNSNNNTYEYFIERRPDGVGIYSYGSLYIFYYGSITSDAPLVKIQF